MNDLLTDQPAFILGNSPYLPTDALDCLADRVTIGVNRIVEVFTPTVVMWVDRSVYADMGEQIDRCGALPICNRAVRVRQGHVGLKTWVGEEALRRSSQPNVLCCNGNTGCMAARWGAALGCRPVYLVGMEARYRDGRTDFWGRNPHHRRVGMASTLDVIRAELDRLLRDCPDDVVSITDGLTLREVAAMCDRVDQNAAREHIRQLLKGLAVESA